MQGMPRVGDGLSCNIGSDVCWTGFWDGGCILRMARAHPKWVGDYNNNKNKKYKKFRIHHKHLSFLVTCTHNML
jgi:hypothetical protein